MRAYRSFIVLVAVLTAAGLLPSVPASADTKQIKLYKEAFPDEKPKCARCHVDEKPKKDDGQHELNDYGKNVLEINKEPDAETYKKAGV